MVVRTPRYGRQHAVYTPSFGGDPTGGVVTRPNRRGPHRCVPTPIDSIEEFKVTHEPTADFNSSAGAQVQKSRAAGPILGTVRLRILSG